MIKYLLMFLLLIMSNSVWGLCLKPTAKQGAIADTVTTGIALNFTNAIEVSKLNLLRKKPIACNYIHWSLISCKNVFENPSIFVE